jgi:hypothetical protein
MTAVLESRQGRMRATGPAHLASAPDSVAPTPLFTRHMLGAIEADRDRRRVFRETHPRPRPGTNGTAHPRIAAAIAAHTGLVNQTGVGESRRFDPPSWSDFATATRR